MPPLAKWSGYFRAAAQQGCGGEQHSAPAEQQSALALTLEQHACGGSQHSAPAAQQSA